MMPVMATYAGPATLILPDGSEFEVMSALRSRLVDGRRDWRGTLTVEPPSGLSRARDRTCVLRTIDGETGELVVTTVRSEPASEVAEVVGNGPAPF
jgi:hypothetical protein